MRRGWIILILASFAALRGAEPAAPLERAVESWLGERDHWAFTQRATEYRDGQPHERLERFDPSQPGNQRWRLIAIDGKPPTPQQQAAWEKRKFKKNPRKFDSPIGDYFDFEHAKVVREDAKTIHYTVPLQANPSWLFPTDKVDVLVSVNKETRALEHLTAHVREPFKVLLGIARITGGTLDLGFEDSVDAEPSAAQPTGTARVSVSRFGERVDFTWSDFKRVMPYSGPAVEAAGIVPAR
jgi:hypothetical protein